MKKLNLFLLLAFALFGTIGLISCEAPQDRDSQMEEEMEEAGDEVSEAFRMERDELRADLEETQREVEDRINELESDLEAAGEEASAEINQELEQLRAWKENLDSHMERIEGDIEAEWSEFSTNVQRTLNEIEQEWEMEEEEM